MKKDMQKDSNLLRGNWSNDMAARCATTDVQLMAHVWSLFRGMCVNTQQWLIGYLYRQYSPHGGIVIQPVPQDHKRPGLDSFMPGEGISNSTPGSFVHESTIGQNTRLTALNSYSGESDFDLMMFTDDIVEDRWGRTFVVEISSHFQQVRLLPYNKKAQKAYPNHYGVEIFSWIYPDNELAIIGNIHDEIAHCRACGGVSIFKLHYSLPSENMLEKTQWRVECLVCEKVGHYRRSKVRAAADWSGDEVLDG